MSKSFGNYPSDKRVLHYKTSLEKAYRLVFYLLIYEMVIT